MKNITALILALILVLTQLAVPAFATGYEDGFDPFTEVVSEEIIVIEDEQVPLAVDPLDPLAALVGEEIIPIEDEEVPLSADPMDPLAALVGEEIIPIEDEAVPMGADPMDSLAAAVGEEIIPIEDEEVPLAAAPQTFSMPLIFAGCAVVLAAAYMALRTARK